MAVAGSAEKDSPINPAASGQANCGHGTRFPPSAGSLSLSGALPRVAHPLE
jgi:hypothetical protein